MTKSEKMNCHLLITARRIDEGPDKKKEDDGLAHEKKGISSYQLGVDLERVENG